MKRYYKLLAAITMLSVVMFFTPLSAQAAVNFVQNVGKAPGTVTSTTLAFTSNNTAGNFIAVGVWLDASGRTVTVTDSVGNTYALAKRQANTTNVFETFILYAMNIGGGANTLTISIDGAAAVMRVIQYEFSGVALTNALDQTAGAEGTGTAVDSGSVVTGENNELIFVVGGSFTNVAWTAGTNYLNLLQIAAGAGKVAGEWQNLATAGSISGTFTLGASASWTGAIATFKSSSTATHAKVTILGGKTTITGGKVIIN